MAKRKPYFDPVDTKVDFPKMEREILDYWNKAGIVKKYLQKNKASKKRFSFLDGPITANNPMGVHHAWGRTYKDLWQRFYNMRGYRQRFQNGFDCQGLWVEVEVEKELGLKSKKDIENLVSGDVKKSIARFVELCKKRVYKYSDIQTEQSKRLGYFMDWDNSYYTLSDENNYMIWHFLKRCHQKGLIYKGRDSVPWCPRCGTAISQHEILTEDYQEITHDAIFVAYPITAFKRTTGFESVGELNADMSSSFGGRPATGGTGDRASRGVEDVIKEKKDEYLLIWTTTPWTLPANVAVAVNPKLDYVLAKDQKTSRKYYLLENVAKNLGLQVVKKLKGSKLVGLTYSSPFDNLSRVKEKLGKYTHRVVVSDDRILSVSTEEGTGLVHIATGAGGEDFALGKKEKLPVVDVIGEDAVYLEALGEFSGKNAKDHPEIIIKYLEKGEYLFKKHKFRHRYPVCWRCKTELVWRVVDEWYIAMDPIRSDMKKIAKKTNWLPEFGLKRELDWLKNMHDWLISKKRYWGLALPIWECSNCKHFEVIGSKEELKKRAVKGWGEFGGHSPHRPWVDEVRIKCAQCGGESIRITDVGNPWLDAGIVPYSTITKNNKGNPLYQKDKKEWRKWFPADFITESFPGQFKNWFYAMIAESAVLENREPYKTVLGFATLLGEDGKAMHKSLGNAIEFNEGADKIGVDVMRWMYVRQDPEHNLLFGHKKADEVRRRFHLKVWNIYNFFITYANADGWIPGHRSPVTGHRLSVLDRWVVSRLNQTIKEVTKNLEDYDAYRASEEIEEFVEDLSNWFIRRSRERVGPTAKNKVDKKSFFDTSYFILVSLIKLLAPFTPYLSDVIYRNLTKEDSVHLSDWPEVKGKISKDLIRQMKSVREAVEFAHAERKAANIPVRQPLNSLVTISPSVTPHTAMLIFFSEELNVKKIDWKKGKTLTVKLDTKITSDLEEEGRARELVRKIQNERRRLGVELTHKVNISSPWVPSSKEVTQWVLERTMSVKLEKGKFKITKAF